MNEALEQFLNKNSDRALKWSETIERMLSHPDLYGYAESTLIGILENIEERGSITDGQIQAIENIKAKPASSYGRRRY